VTFGSQQALSGIFTAKNRGSIMKIQIKVSDLQNVKVAKNYRYQFNVMVQDNVCKVARYSASQWLILTTPLRSALYGVHYN